MGTSTTQHFGLHLVLLYRCTKRSEWSICSWRMCSRHIPKAGISLFVVRDSSAVWRLIVRLAGAMGRQSALHKENSGFAAPTLGRHISPFRDYWIFFLSETLIYITSPIIFLFIHNHLTLRKCCYTPLQHDFALDPIIPPFDFHFRIYKRDLAITVTHCMMGAT